MDLVVWRDTSVEVCEVLIQNGAKIRSSPTQDDLKWIVPAPLVSCCQEDTKRIMHLLIKYGAPMEAKHYKDAVSPLQMCLQRKAYATADVLLEHGLNVSQETWIFHARHRRDLRIHTEHYHQIILRLVGTPPTLQMLCRTAVRDHLYSKDIYFPRIAELPLPGLLKDYLLVNKKEPKVFT